MFGWSDMDFAVLPATLIIIILISLVLYAILKNKKDRIKEIPLVVITCILLVMEVVKQVREFKSGYDNWAIPLHFCSLFLYFYPLAVFAKGKIKDFGKTMSLVCSSLMFIMFYINPDSIIGRGTTANFLTSYGLFHTFIYHHLVVLFLVLSIMLNFYKFKKENFIHVLIGFSLYAIISVPMAHVLNTNFCNILEGNVPIIESFRLFVGQIWYTVALYTFSIVAGMGIVAIHGRIEK